MILGIDPKNDYAFRCIYGSEHHTSVLIALLNAMLQPPSRHEVVSVEILNPITEPLKLDDKLAILDIKARDQSGRYFNVEMQMVLHPAVESRFLYYWAKTYSSQLVQGDQYDRLAPVVTICFLDGLLFPNTDAYHLKFRLCDTDENLTYSDDLAIHIIQLPNFVKITNELETELDFWLYFLNNGKDLDPDQLSEPLRFPAFLEAVAIMQTLTQDDIKREYYEAREKARRDALSWKWHIERAQQEAQQAQQEAQQAQQEARQAQQEARQAQQELERARHEARQAKQELERARQEVMARQERIAEESIHQIRLYEQLLQRTPSPHDTLKAMSLEELQNRAAQLRQEVTR